VIIKRYQNLNSLHLVISITAVFISILFHDILFADTTGSYTNQKKIQLDREVTSRLTFIQTALDEGVVNANRWYYSWMIIHGTSTFYSLGATLTMDDPDDRDLRYDSAVSMILSSYAVADLLLTPIPARTSAGILRKLPATNSIERTRKLHVAENYLEHCARVERGWRSWEPHVFLACINAAGGMIIAFGDDRKKDGLVSFIVGMLVAEFQIFTAPSRAIDDWEEYNRRFIRSYESKHQSSSWMNDFQLVAYPKGCGIRYSF
jgi:hypothetical protein